MEERVIKEQGDRDIALIKELKLNNCKSSNVAGLSEDWKSLECLNLANVGLTTLKGFPRLPNLKKLELSNNNLCEGLDALACLPKLEEIDLSENNIKDFDVFEPLTQINTLTSLILTGCDICKMENYREKIFELIPSLSSLDGEKKSESKKEEEKAEAAVNGEKEDAEAAEDDDDDSSIEALEDSDEDEEGEEGEDIPLDVLYDKINDEGDDDDDFEVVEDEEDEDIEEEEDEEDTSAHINEEDETEETEDVRGTKRKHEED